MHVVTIAAAALVAAVSLASMSKADDPVVVTRNSQALPGGCTPRETAQLLARFAEAVNTGDPAALDQIFVVDDPPGRAAEAGGTAFRWFSMTEGRAGASRPWRHETFYDRGELFPYFAERHAQNERWELLSVRVTSSRTREAGITYAFRRTADDLPPWLNGLATGKGAIDCAAGRIFVWSSGQNDASAGSGITCPRPRGWSPGDAILACTLGPNARPLAPEFRLQRTTRLPGRCAPERALGTLRSALRSFNSGLGDEFAKRFARDSLLASRGAELRSRKRIASFAYTRYHAGEGWGARVLRAPNRVRQSVADYWLELVVSRPIEAPAAGRAEIALDCASGLIRRWRGP